MWNNKGSDPWVVEVLQWGYRIPFRWAPILSKEPIPYPAFSPNSIRGKALEKEVRSLFDKGAIELAPLPSPGFYSWLFVVMNASGVWRRSHRPLATESEGAENILQDGDSPVRTFVSSSWRLDGVSRLEGCLLVGSDASGVLQVSQVCGVWEGVPVQSSLLWPVHSSSSFHTGHGSCFGISSQDRHSVTSVSRRLADPSQAGPPCSGNSSSALQFGRDSRQLGEVAADSNSAHGVSGGSFGLHLFQGFSCPEKSREASLNWRRILVLRKTACVIWAGAAWGAVLNDSARSRREASDEVAPVYSPSSVGSGGSVCSGFVDSRDSARSRVVA